MWTAKEILSRKKSTGLSFCFGQAATSITRMIKTEPPPTCSDNKHRSAAAPLAGTPAAIRTVVYVIMLGKIKTSQNLTLKRKISLLGIFGII